MRVSFLPLAFDYQVLYESIYPTNIYDVHVVIVPLMFHLNDKRRAWLVEVQVEEALRSNTIPLLICCDNIHIGKKP